MTRVSVPAIGATVLLLLSACGGDSGSGTLAPTVTLDVSPPTVAAYQTATLTWSSTNASACSATGTEWAGPQPTSGSLPQTLSTPGTYTYTLNCSSSSGVAASSSASLAITPAPLTITGTLSNGVIGVPFNQTIQATGGVAPFDWTVSSGALPHSLYLCPSTTNNVTVCGTPDTVVQAATFTIEVADSDRHTASQAFTVSILLQADSLVLSPVSLDFGNQILGRRSGALTEKLTNTASSDMVISSVAIATNQGSNAGEFTKASSTCGASLAAGASCAVNLIFNPMQPGPRTAALTITDDTAGSPQSVPLNGVGLNAGPNATLSVVGVTFGTQLVGTTSPAQTLSLTNYGIAALNVGSISATASFAEQDTCVPSLASGASCTISVTFTPGGSGNVTGTLSITDDAAGSPQKIALRGNGSTRTPPLTGYCFARCIGTVKDSAQCPVGQPAETPDYAYLYPCGDVDAQVPVDYGRRCLVRAPRYVGNCVTQ